LVIAVEALLALTQALFAGVPLGTKVAVGAGPIGGYRLTAQAGVAVVGGARVLVIAQEHHLDLAATRLAVITKGTGVLVIALGLIGHMGAVSLLAASVIGARVVVIAGLLRAAHALGVDALVLNRAGVPIGAGAIGGLVGAAAVYEAGVGGAGVLVVAGEQAISHALSLHAAVSGRALVAVVTLSVVGHEQAAELGIARVVRAGVLVIADQGRA
jgi:hypothetical protein